ncbi:MAG: FAD-binding oxidoreductase [Ignavibacteria bacterium]|nr:FAD-binding oxidoreductase [Ignavibacteria bacterium]
MHKNLMLSFWERNSFINYDYIIIGGGLLGLSTACEIKERFPNKDVLILERGVLPSGASTKNAGFLCYGSLTEILADIRNKGEDETVSLVEKRWKGMNKLRVRFRDENIGFVNSGEYELIDERYISSLDEITKVNSLLKEIFKDEETFRCDRSYIERFGFSPEVVKNIIYSPYESQIDTGRMMRAAIRYAVSLGVVYLTGAEVAEFTEKSDGVEVYVEHNVFHERIGFKSSALIICANAFSSSLTGNYFPKPARGLVIITKPLDMVKLNGIYHYDEGYYYFRNYGNRVILGGGRNLDFQGEETTAFGINDKIYKALLEFLGEVILPYTEFEVDVVWSGIMGFTENKLPQVKKISDRVFSAVSCNGMGIALSSVVAEDVVKELPA